MNFGIFISLDPGTYFFLKPACNIRLANDANDVEKISDGRLVRLLGFPEREDAIGWTLPSGVEGHVPG